MVIHNTFIQYFPFENLLIKSPEKNKNNFKEGPIGINCWP